MWYVVVSFLNRARCRVVLLFAVRDAAIVDTTGETIRRCDQIKENDWFGWPSTPIVWILYAFDAKLGHNAIFEGLLDICWEVFGERVR